MPIGACCRRTWHGWNCFVMTCTGCGSRLALLPVLLIRRFISYSGKTSLCTTMSSGRSSLEGASSMHASKGRRSSTPLNCICGSGISCIRRSGLTRSPHRTSEHMPWRLIEVLVCMQCRLHFASFAGECVHMCRAHGVIAKERFLFDGDTMSKLPA